MSPRPRLLYVVLIPAAVLMASCSSVPEPTPAPRLGQPVVTGPVLVRGTVFDRAGRPAPGARVELSVKDTRNAEIGEPVPLVLVRDYTSHADGTFEIRLEALPALKQHAAANGGWVNFDLMAVTANGIFVAFWAFPRQIQGDAWAAEVPIVELRPPR